ncbi:MAG: hypothetical protein A2042_06090 [Candidatus Schekmanbacteria bacterium GWA2_38_11]|uniref:Radical SAM core domain-containing protein n=1 Tax=Candidatus Schekmanbacteria bacterium GWA2_38_11 TaxID=1817876 RepID=A0A1F7RP41_9BACT|nr:MAG: hypothetical protein A2042_06090 [Candidatus Schekmanbacteria bacterium GWA2_38_11]
METLFIVLTTECNRSCPFCFYVTGYQRRVEEKLNVDLIANFLDYLKKFGLRQVIFTGGEPLIRKDLFTVIKISSEKGLQNLLITNGDFLHDEIIPKLMKSGVNALLINFHSLKEQKNQSLIPVIKKLSAIRTIPITLTTPVTKKNLEEIEKIYQFSKSLSIGQIFQPAFIPQSNPSFKELSLRKADEREWSIIKKTLNKWAEDLGTEDYVKLIYDLYEGKNPKPKNCTMGTNAFVLNADGNLIPCFHRGNLVIGNILKDRFDDILNNLYKLSSELSEAKCFGEHCISLFTHL